MPIGTELDYTPAYTVSTLQFQNEPLNVIVTSLLAVLILVNIGSAVSKLVYFTRATNFSYDSWVRSFIFANSDDPIRVLSWLRRYYAYRDKKWIRGRNHLRPGRLLVPLLARGVILIASIASVAITIPSEKRMPPCKEGDYGLSWDETKGLPSDPSPSVCLDIPVSSRLGTVRSSATFCNCPQYIPSDLPSGITSITVTLFPASATGLSIIGNRNAFLGHNFYIEWKTGPKYDQTVYRSDISSLDLKTFARIIVRTLRRLEPSCSTIISTNITNSVITSFLSCDVTDLVDTSQRISTAIRNALVMDKRPDKQPRLVLRGNKFQREDDPNSDCPIQVTVTRPIVNIVPLTISLALWFIVNLIVSYAVSKHGNALDAAFHLVKEALGHDSTSNALELNIERNEIMELDLRKWHCPATGGGYVGFLGREGDTPVKEFDPTTVVGGPVRTRLELDRVHAVTASAPGSRIAPLPRESPPQSVASVSTAAVTWQPPAQPQSTPTVQSQSTPGAAAQVQGGAPGQSDSLPVQLQAPGIPPSNQFVPQPGAPPGTHPPQIPVVPPTVASAPMGSQDSSIAGLPLSPSQPGAVGQHPSPVPPQPPVPGPPPPYPPQYRQFGNDGSPGQPGSG